MVLIPCLGLLIIGFFYLRGGRWIETENAYVKADKVPISASVAGVVSQVMVAENQAVKKGDVLFLLDDASFVVSVQRATAKLGQVATDLKSIKASYGQKQAEIKQAKTKLAFAIKEQQRQADLVNKNFVTASRFDEAKQMADITSDQILMLEQDLRKIAESLGGKVDMPVQLHPSYQSAKAELDQSQLDLSRTRVLAQQAGYVSKPPKVGQYLSIGSTAMALVASQQLWVEANYTETELTYLRDGQKAIIHIDTYPQYTWQGVLTSVSPATGSEFSVIPAQNATGNWVKITQRVPVHIDIKNNPDAPPLRAGLSATVEVDSGHKRRLLGFSF